MEDQTVSNAHIRKYEDMIENKIKPSLTKEMNSLKELSSLMEQYEILRTNITLMKKDEESILKSLVSIGSEVYVHAKACDRNHIFINIGLGFHVEFTLNEALVYIEKKLQSLQIDVLVKNADVERTKEHYYSAIHSLEQLKQYISCFVC